MNSETDSNLTKKQMETTQRSKNEEFLKGYIESIKSSASNCKINAATNSFKNHVKYDVTRNQDMSISEAAFNNLNDQMVKSSSITDTSGVQAVRKFNDIFVKRNYSIISFYFSIHGVSKSS